MTLYYGEEDSEFSPKFKTNVPKQIVELGITFGFINRKGAYYDYGDIRVQGIDNFVSTLEDKGLLKEIEKKVYETM